MYPYVYEIYQKYPHEARGATSVKSNLFNLSSTVKIQIENLKKLGKAKVEFLMLILTQHF